MAAATEAGHQVTVIVVTYNSAHCLPALGVALSGFPHVIVVDNGSDDGCVQSVPQHMPQAQVLALPTNLGFGAANNRALAQVRTPFALLLNPDCEIDADTVARLLQTAMRYPEAAVVAPQLLDAGQRPEVNYRWPLQSWRSQGPGADHGPACVGFVCGAAMLLRLSVFADVGFFDEDFFLYYEDDDLCLRLFQAHKPMLIDPTCVAVHRSRGSVRGRHRLRSEYLRGYHHAQSKLIFASKHQSMAAARHQRQRLLATALLAMPLRLLAPSPRLVSRLYGRICGLIRWSPP